MSQSLLARIFVPPQYRLLKAGAHSAGRLAEQAAIDGRSRAHRFWLWVGYLFTYRIEMTISRAPLSTIEVDNADAKRDEQRGLKAARRVIAQ